MQFPDVILQFIRAYSVKDAITGSFRWFGAFSQDTKDNVELMKTKLNMPVLTMGGQYFAAAFLKDHTKIVANDVHETNIPNSGHWLVQENTAAVQKGLLEFFLERK